MIKYETIDSKDLELMDFKFKEELDKTLSRIDINKDYLNFIQINNEMWHRIWSQFSTIGYQRSTDTLMEIIQKINEGLENDRKNIP